MRCAIIWEYGGYQHPDNECIVTFFGEARAYNQRGRMQVKRRRMVIDGEIIAADTAAIDARVAQIKTAYALDGGNALLRTSAGVATQYELPAFGALSGPRVGFEFLAQDGQAHYATGLPFRITLEADYQANDSDPLVSYVESITVIGHGGPRRVVVEVDSGQPITQTVSTNSPVVVIQAGEAVGSLAYPSFNPPLFFTRLDMPDGYQQTRDTPRLAGNQWVDWPVRWAYRMTLESYEFIPNPQLR